MSERSELQVALDALFTKEDVTDSSVSMYVINRFMAWSSELAPFAAAISRVRDDDMAREIWRSALPRRASAPRLFYPAPRSRKDEVLVETISIAHPHLTGEPARTAVAIAEAMGHKQDMMITYGVEEKDD